MKGIYPAIVICILVGMLIPVPVKADGLTSISGIVTDETTTYPVNGVELAFENLRTEETIYAQTNQYGYYYLSLSSFTEGWLSGDDVEVTTSAEGFDPYNTVVSLESTWPSPNLGLAPRLFPIQTGDLEDPDTEDILWLEYICIGNSGSYNYGSLTYKYPSQDYTYKPDGGTDGVVTKGYIRVQDDGSWVPAGRTYRVVSHLGLKIEKNIGQYVYYGDENDDPVQIHLTDNNGNPYYEISRNNGVTIDPIHKAILPKDGTHAVDGIKLKISISYDYDIDDYTGGNFQSHVISASYPYVKYITYDWDYGG